MATGSIAFTPNPADGSYFFLEPVRTLSAAIVDYSEGFSGAELRADLFAFGVILFISTAVMTLGAKLVAIPIERRLQGRA
jgi:ABC-type phosphate transport system permease subunit